MPSTRVRCAARSGVVVISRILLSRIDGVGDALACAPLVAALRDVGHEVGALLVPRNRDAFAPNTFAHVHVVERIPWPRHGLSPGSRADALSEARSVGYDVALIASEEPDAYAFARDAGISRRVGFTNGWEKPFKTLRLRPLLTRAIVRPASSSRAREHEVETLFRLGEGFHPETEPTRALTRLRPLVLEAEPKRHGAIAVQLNAKFVSAGIDIAAFAEIVRDLSIRGHSVAAISDDDVFGTAFATRAATTFVHPSDLSEWKALIAGARAVVTPDSGASHVAGMLGVPTVVLFPSGGRSLDDVARWRPWAAPARAVIADRTADFGELVAREVESLLA
jgi:ADP-heptose:LPS heptosyltransferase